MNRRGSHEVDGGTAADGAAGGVAVICTSIMIETHGLSDFICMLVLTSIGIPQEYVTSGPGERSTVLAVGWAKVAKNQGAVGPRVSSTMGTWIGHVDSSDAPDTGMTESGVSLHDCAPSRATSLR